MGTFIIVLLIVLLLFSDRIASAGKALGEGVRNFKRAVRGPEAPAAEPEPPRPPPLAPIVKQAPPKLLPAKGETTRGSDEPASDNGREERKA